MNQEGIEKTPSQVMAAVEPKVTGNRRIAMLTGATKDTYAVITVCCVNEHPLDA